MKKLTICFVIMLAVSFSCSNDNEDDLVTNDPEPEFVTYQDVRSIFSNNCLGCHASPPSNGASVPLTNFNQVKSAVENDMLIDRINSNEPGYAMPLGGTQLPQNLIDLIEQWEEDGLLEN